MLKPSMQELLGKVGNRYLLVNLAAQRARDLSDEVDETGECLDEKPVKLALDEIADGSIVYCSGPRISEDVQYDTDFTGAFHLDFNSVQNVELFESKED